MVDKICEIIKTIPRDKPFVDVYELAEYFYSKGVRVIPQGYWLTLEGEGYQCSVCGSRYDTAEGLYCAQCGAQMAAEVEIKLIKTGFSKIAGFVEVNKKKWKKWKKKKFRMKVACSAR